MSLNPGTRLGPYEVLSVIGAGGMGEVYQARDTRLERMVAVKVLPASLAADAAFKFRFEREAKSISALNHPHICTLHDVGSHDGTDFLVMELVEGETIADRLARSGALRTDDVLTYGIQIADALDRAHRQGIIHRDLKPGNIIITKSGIKLLDFGLAKMLPQGQGDTAMLSTVLADLTMQGTIVGTLHYMAPEQVEARQTDARTDIFAFGAVLYEMATGEKAFPGRSQASVIAAILDRDPPPVSSRGSLSPPELDRVVATCLAKDPDDRWQSARDLGRALQWIAQRQTSAPGARSLESAWRPSVLLWSLACAALLFGALIGAALTWAWLRDVEDAPRSETRFSIELPFTPRSANWVNTQAAISPDGSRIVYQGGRDPDRVLYLRELGDPTAHKINGTESGQNPFFASDGRSIGFFADGELKKISLLGGPAVKICDAPDVPYGATWYRDTIVFSTGTGLATVAAGGGVPRNLTSPPEQTRRGGHRSPVFLPGGETVIFVALSNELPGVIEAVDVSSGARHVLVPDLRPESRGVQYLSSGHLLYEQNQSLVAQAFDARTLKVRGAPVPVQQGVATMGSTMAQFAVSDTGTLVYIPHADLPDETVTWVTREGNEQPLPFPRGRYQTPRVSPDGSRLIVVGDRGSTAPILLANLMTGTFGELPRQKGTYGPSPIPAWTADGISVTYTGANQRDQMIQPADRSSGERVLFTLPRLPRDGSWTRRADGDVVAITIDPDDVLVWSSASGKPTPLLQTPFSESSPAFSPDGRWIAYTSTQTRAAEVWVQPFRGDGKAVQVSVGGGSHPAWGPGGRELFYLQGSVLMAVSVTVSPKFSTTLPKRVMDLAAFNLEGRSRNYDVDPKTGRFVMVKTVGGPAARAQLVVAVDWMTRALERIRLTLVSR